MNVNIIQARAKKRLCFKIIQARVMRWREEEIQQLSLTQRGSRFLQIVGKDQGQCICFRWCCTSTGAPRIQTVMATLIVFLLSTTFRFPLQASDPQINAN